MPLRGLQLGWSFLGKPEAAGQKAVPRKLQMPRVVGSTGSTDRVGLDFRLKKKLKNDKQWVVLKKSSSVRPKERNPSSGLFSYGNSPTACPSSLSPANHLLASLVVFFLAQGS